MTTLDHASLAFRTGSRTGAVVVPVEATLRVVRGR